MVPILMKYLIFILFPFICFGQTYIDQTTKDTIIVTQSVSSVVTVKKYIPPTAGTQTFNLSFTPIPFSDPDLNSPGRGAEQWHDQNLIDGVKPPTDVYYRFTWARIETSQGVYDWSYLINILNSAIQKRQKVSFGIMSVYHDPEDGVISYDGFRSAYPEYLHRLMQLEQFKDWHTSEGWVPNYNSQNYLTRIRARNNSLNTLLETGSFQGVKYKDIINSIDIRDYGNYGEWHNGGLVDYVSQIPTGAHATTASLKAIIAAYTQSLPNFQLSIIMTAFDANWLQHTKTSPEVAYYALTTANAYGPLGWRRDNWGATDDYIKDLLVNNTRTWNGVALNSLIMEVWKKAPITGEPMNTAPNEYGDFENQVRLYHASSFGNGNINQQITTNLKNNVRAASKASGYRIILTTGQIVQSSGSLKITLNWQNIGIAPTYEKWIPTYEIVDAAGKVIWSAASNFKPRLFIGSNSVTETFLNVPNLGTLRIVVKDPTGYRSPLPLAIQGRNSDGSYNLKTF